MSYLTQALGAAKLLLKAHGPTLMVAGGVVSMGAGTVVACKKTLHLADVLEAPVEVLDQIEDSIGMTGYTGVEYTPEKARSDRFKVYSRAAYDVSKLYFVPGVLFSGGAAMVFAGHRIMLQRNATLAIAFTAVTNAFDAYRTRVSENFGSETDQAMLNGWVKKEVIDPETGKVEEINTRDWDNEVDPYNRVFEQGESSQWEPDLAINKMFIANQMRHAQWLLNQQGFLYLSDVYKALGFEESDISRVVGWKVTRLPDGSRNIPVVDFGLDRPHPDDWKYGREQAIYLDFNCHGLIVGGKIQKALEKA